MNILIPVVLNWMAYSKRSYDEAETVARDESHDCVDSKVKRSSRENRKVETEDRYFDRCARSNPQRLCCEKRLEKFSKCWTLH